MYIYNYIYIEDTQDSISSSLLLKHRELHPLNMTNSNRCIYVYTQCTTNHHLIERQNI